MCVFFVSALKLAGMVPIRRFYGDLVSFQVFRHMNTNVKRFFELGGYRAFPDIVTPPPAHPTRFPRAACRPRHAVCLWAWVAGGRSSLLLGVQET